MLFYNAKNGNPDLVKTLSFANRFLLANNFNTLRFNFSINCLAKFLNLQDLTNPEKVPGLKPDFHPSSELEDRIKLDPIGKSNF